MKLIIDNNKINKTKNWWVYILEYEYKYSKNNCKNRFKLILLWHSLHYLL